MRAARFHAFGGPEVVRVEEVPDPAPGPGEVLVEVRAAALNHLDLWVRRGLPMRIEMPHVGGADFAGVVLAVGEEVSELAPGKAVVGYPLLGFGRVPWPACGERPTGAPVLLGEQRNGAFCERICVPAANLVALPHAPSRLSFVQAACLPVAFVTAWTMLRERARLDAGETLVVLGAGSGVGSAAVQVGRDRGARVLALTRSPRKAEALAKLGAETRVVDEPAKATREVLRATEGHGADVVFEHVGGDWWAAAVAMAAYGGRIACCGATAGRTGALDLRMLFAKQLEVHGVTLGPRRVLEQVLERAASGHLAAVVEDVLPLDGCREAHARLEAGEVFGKLVLEPAARAAAAPEP